MIYIHIVFQCCYSICYITYDYTIFCLSFKVFHINVFIIIHKKPNIKNFYNVTSKLFFEYSIFWCFLSLLFFSLSRFQLFSIWRSGFISRSCKKNFHYIIHEHFTCIFTYHIFIYRRLGHFQFSQENATPRWKKKTK